MTDYSRISYTAKYKAIAPYVKFKRGKIRELSRSKKSKITRYYHLLIGQKFKERQSDGTFKYSGESGLLSRSNHHLVRRLSRQDRKIAAAYAQEPVGYPELRGVLIPVGEEKTRHTFRFKTSRGGRRYLEVDEKHVTRSFYAFTDYETGDLIMENNAGEIITRLLKQTRKKGKRNRRFKLATGKHQTNDSFTETEARAKAIDIWTNPKYSDQEQWALGIIEFNYKSYKKDWIPYARAESKARKEKQARLKKIRKQGYQLKSRRKS